MAKRTRNMECIETISRNIIRWIDENPLVDCIAFWPKDVALSSNLFIDEATWSATGLRTCGKPDGSCLIGTDFDENLAA